VSETEWRTHRLELDDQTLREWDSTVLASDPEGIVLDSSAFYPGGGGQPPDHGVLLWGGVQTRIAGARKGDDLYLIPAEGDPLPPVGTAVRGALDDERRTACTCSAVWCSATSAPWSPAGTWNRSPRGWTST
jgi:misacylated tRNA(Ala) deacylase